MTDPTPKPTENESEFARLLAQHEGTKTFQTGQVVKGTVVQIGPSDVFLDIGDKSEATIARAELLDDNGELTIKEGETLEATVTAIGAEGVRLSRKLLKGAQALTSIENAFRNNIPVQGRVAAAIKGGFEVIVAGQRTFCPLSQIDLRRVEDPQAWVGRTEDFRVIEFRDRGRSIVLSRRRLLEESSAAAAQETWKKAFPGAVLTGTVMSLADFGAFVDLGGVQGLIHISEIAFERVSKPGDYLKPGQQVTVKVLRVDTEKNRISLSLKAMLEDPWAAAAAQVKEGEVVRGRLLRVTDFGAFVEIRPGVDGLVHVSTAPPAFFAEWRSIAGSKPEVEVRILRVDVERKRISLEPAG